MHVHATVAGVEMHARARATGKATPAAIYSYSRNALPVLVRDGSTADLLALNLRCAIESTVEYHRAEYSCSLCRFKIHIRVFQRACMKN